MHLGPLQMAGWSRGSPPPILPSKGSQLTGEGIQHRADTGSACSVVVADTLTDQDPRGPWVPHRPRPASAVRLAGGGAHTLKGQTRYHVRHPARGLDTQKGPGTISLACPGNASEGEARP